MDAGRNELDGQYARVRELKAGIAPNMPRWDAPADASYNTPDRASFEAACLLDAIEMDLRDAITMADPDTIEVAVHDDEAWAEVEHQDSENFTNVLSAATDIHDRLKYLSEWVPPQGMAYIRRVVGDKLLEEFEELARKEFQE